MDPLDHNDQAAAIFPDERHLTTVSAAPDTFLTPTEKKKARAALTRFLLLCEQHRAIISYTQARPFDPTVNPETGFSGDCSALPTQAFKWVVTHTGVPLVDPNGYHYSGWGYTGTLLSENHRHAVPLNRRFFVGDLAIYGPFYSTRHVVICRKGGYEADSVWSSHGSSLGPLPVKLRYRRDLLGVYRPTSLL
jgi:hypothetical protein